MIIKREMRDIINKLEYKAKKLKTLSTFTEVSYEKTLELRAQRQEIYNKLQFYKNLLTINNSKSR